MTIDINTLSLEQLKRAVGLKEQISALEAELAGLLGAPRSAAAVAIPGKRTLSAETRAKMAAAHQARWAKIRAAKGAPKAAPASAKAPTAAKGAAKVPQAPAVPKAPAKRTMTPAGRARLIASVKARWAAVKAKGKGKL